MKIRKEIKREEQRNVKELRDGLTGDQCPSHITSAPKRKTQTLKRRKVVRIGKLIDWYLSERELWFNKKDKSLQESLKDIHQ